MAVYKVLACAPLPFGLIFHGMKKKKVPRSRHANEAFTVLDPLLAAENVIWWITNLYCIYRHKIIQRTGLLKSRIISLLEICEYCDFRAHLKPETKSLRIRWTREWNAANFMRDTGKPSARGPKTKRFGLKWQVLKFCCLVSSFLIPLFSLLSHINWF